MKLCSVINAILLVGAVDASQEKNLRGSSSLAVEPNLDVEEEQQSHRKLPPGQPNYGMTPSEHMSAYGYVDGAGYYDGEYYDGGDYAAGAWGAIDYDWWSGGGGGRGGGDRGYYTTDTVTGPYGGSVTAGRGRGPQGNYVEGVRYEYGNGGRYGGNAYGDRYYASGSSGYNGGGYYGSGQGQYYGSAGRHNNGGGRYYTESYSGSGGRGRGYEYNSGYGSGGGSYATQTINGQYGGYGTRGYARGPNGYGVAGYTYDYGH